MMQAFVGIVSQQGIELFYPEDPATVRFLWRRAQLQKGRVACFWSVLPSDAAFLIQSAVALGWNLEALGMLQRHSRDYGCILPVRDDPLSSPIQHQLG